MAAILRRHRFPIIVITFVLLLMLFSWYFRSRRDFVVNSAPVSYVYKNYDDEIQLFAEIKQFSSDVTIISPNIEEEQPQVISIPKLAEDEEIFPLNFLKKIVKESTKYVVDEHFVPTQQETDEVTVKLTRKYEEKLVTTDGKESTKYVVEEHLIPSHKETNEFTAKLKKEHEEKFITADGKESTKYAVDEHLIPAQKETNEFTAKLKKEHEKFITADGKESTKYVVDEHLILAKKETNEFTAKLKKEHEEKFITADGKESTKYVVEENFIPAQKETNEFTAKLQRKHEEKLATADVGALRLPVKLQHSTKFQSPSNIGLETDTKNQYNQESPFPIPSGGKQISLSTKEGLLVKDEENEWARRDFVKTSVSRNINNTMSLMSTKQHFMLNQPQFSAIKSNITSTKNSALLIDTPGCKIPKLNPWDPSVKDFIELQEPYVCPGPQVFMSSNPGGSISLNETILKNYHNMTPEELVCHYRPIYRKYEEEGSDMEISISFGNLLKLEFEKPLDEDYVSVLCNVSRMRFEQHFPLVRLKDNVEEERNSIVSPNPTLNVILIGIDSVSKLNFLRHFPKTHAFLNDKLKPFEMNGYTKVGENTFPNLVPLLTGQFVEHWWNETLKSMFFDNIGFIWKEYAKRGYRTFYAEDSPFVGAFHYLKRGFYDPPTDYYYRPLALALEMWKFQAKLKEFCINSQIEFDLIYNYLKDFTQTMEKRPHFGFAMVSSITHDELNNAGWADEPTERLLEGLLNSGALDNTLLVLFSDHGLRFGEIRNTYIGKFEERLPLMYIHVPKWFLEKYPEIAKNLQTNQDRLMTLFDIHATMFHLLDLSKNHEERSMTTLGRSLFEEIPSYRTCEDANIETHFCPCQEFDIVNSNGPEAVHAAMAIMDDIHSKLEPHHEVCEILEVDAITDARVGKANDIMLQYQGTENEVINRTIYVGDKVAPLVDYMITLVVRPGGGVFEGTVRHNVGNNTFSVLGISRTNMYGTTSWCIDSPKLKLFCYCKIQKQI